MQIASVVERRHRTECRCPVYLKGRIAPVISLHRQVKISKYSKYKESHEEILFCASHRMLAEVKKKRGYVAQVLNVAEFHASMLVQNDAV